MRIAEYLREKMGVSDCEIWWYDVLDPRFFPKLREDWFASLAESERRHKKRPRIIAVERDENGGEWFRVFSSLAEFHKSDFLRYSSVSVASFVPRVYHVFVER